MVLALDEFVSEKNQPKTGQRLDVLYATGGAIFVEYAILVAFVGLVVASALSALAPRVIAEYSDRRALLYSHVP